MKLTPRQRHIWTRNFTLKRFVGRDFPLEHLGVADRFLLKQIAMEQVLYRERLGIYPAYEGFFAAVCVEMEEQYRVKTRPEYKSQSFG